MYESGRYFLYPSSPPLLLVHSQQPQQQQHPAIAATKDKNATAAIAINPQSGSVNGPTATVVLALLAERDAAVTTHLFSSALYSVPSPQKFDETAFSVVCSGDSVETSVAVHSLVPESKTVSSPHTIGPATSMHAPLFGFANCPSGQGVTHMPFSDHHDRPSAKQSTPVSGGVMQSFDAGLHICVNLISFEAVAARLLKSLAGQILPGGPLCAVPGSP